MTTNKSPAPRRVEARRWTLLGTAAIAGLAVATPAAAASILGQAGDAKLKAPAGLIQLAASSQGGEGGEGGEGAARAGNEDAEFLADLGYVEGHLRAGIALYEAGATDMAKTHMKHPGDEIYTILKPQLDSRGADDFGDELAKLAKRVERGASAAKARKAFAKVLHEIEEARDRVGGGEAPWLKAIVLMVRTAAGDYAAGVQNGKVVAIHEYQDAWGFVQAARAMIGELDDSERPEVRAALAKIREQFAVIAPAFPGLVPESTGQIADPSVLYGAAARMEIASLAVK